MRLRNRGNATGASHLEAEDGAAEAGAGGVGTESRGRPVATGRAGAWSEAEDGLVFGEARAVPGRRAPAGRDCGDERREQVDGAVGRGAHQLPRQPPRQQRQHVPRPERRCRRRPGVEVEQQREEDEEPEPLPPLPRLQRRRRHRSPGGQQAELAAPVSFVSAWPWLVVLCVCVARGSDP